MLCDWHSQKEEKEESGCARRAVRAGLWQIFSKSGLVQPASQIMWFAPSSTVHCTVVSFSVEPN